MTLREIVGRAAGPFSVVPASCPGVYGGGNVGSESGYPG